MGAQVVFTPEAQLWLTCFAMGSAQVRELVRQSSTMARRGSRALAFVCGMAVTAWLGDLAFTGSQFANPRWEQSVAKGRAHGVARAAMNVNEQLAAKDRDGISIGQIMALKSTNKQATSTFEKLIAAVDAAGLTDTLNGEGPFTIFAPDDNAFRMQGVDAMTPDQLKMHIFEGLIRQDGFKNREVATMGGPIKMKRGREWVKMNGHAIKRPDVEVSNGVIHVLDGVIEP